jgi:DNA polymerase III subunit epsilon
MIHLIFDTETSGLPLKWDAPLSDTNNWPRLVQLSWIVSDGTDQKEFDFIIKPEGFTIPIEASNIHGITQERAMKEGVSLEFVIKIFDIFLFMADKVVAHNLKFDKAIVGAEYYRLGKGQKYDYCLDKKDKVCTMMDYMEQLGYTKWPKLRELYYLLFEEDIDGAHNSLVDVRACARCYFKLLTADDDTLTKLKNAI